MENRMNRRKMLSLSALVPIASVGLAEAISGPAVANANPAPAVPLLPQHDPAPWARRGAIAQSQMAYTWTENVPFIPGIPAANLVPLDAFPTIEWLFTAADSFITMALNLLGSLIPQLNAAQTGTLADQQKQMLALRQQKNEKEVRFKNLGNGKYNELGPRATPTPEDLAGASILQGEMMAIFHQIQTVLGNIRDNVLALVRTNQGVGNFGTRDGLAMYNAMWQTMPIPQVAENLHDDRMFAWMVVGGWNTNVVERVRGKMPAKMPLTDEQYRRGLGTNDTLSNAIAEGRVFITDYVELGKMAPEHATYKTLTGSGYNSAPIAVFAVAPGSKELQPVAIQLGQDNAKTPILVRPKPDDKTQFWGWQMAKTVVQTANFNHHEMLAHLGRAHLVSEVFAVATHRAFAPNHPIGQLLIPHYEGDIFINFLAATIIMPPNFFADVILAAPLPDIVETVGKDRLAWNFDEHMPRNDFARRGVDDTSQLEYPYRDDAELIWDTLHDWINDYVRVYYHTDKDVTDDHELAAWADEVINQGKMKGFGRIASIERLVDVLTMCAWTASGYHASVNFPQGHLMTYAPFAAGVLETPGPTSLGGHTQADWIKMLPGWLTAIAQFYFLNQLATVYYRPLGDYRTNAFPFPPAFDDPRIVGANGPLEKFRARLKDAEDKINKRNKSRWQPYEYLLPSNIPTSTNI